MGKEYYIASCVFTAQKPYLSAKIQNYVKKLGIPIVRCCIPNYKLQEYVDIMPDDLRDSWASLPDCADFQPGDVVYSLCHNCSNIIEETKPGVIVRSLWELILADTEFAYPDLEGTKAIVQDCWRSRERLEEQQAVRELLKKMHIEFAETAENHENTDYCGNSLYRPQPPRNPNLAPRHYVENAVGKFLPHSAEEQERIMREYCERFGSELVICYCHYCLEGLLLGKANGKHIAEILFPEE